MAPPWILDYVKMGLKHLAEEAVKDAVGRVLEGGAPPDEPPASPYASKYKDSDRASAKQYTDALDRLDKAGFTDVILRENAVYYSQNAKGRWADHPYPAKGRPDDLPPTTRHLDASGCGPTSLAIAHATLFGTPTTPPEVADFAVAHGYSSSRPFPEKPGGTNMRLIGAWAKEHDMDLQTTRDLDQLRDGLKNGGVAVVQVHGGIFNLSANGTLPDKSHGHIIAVNGYAKDKDGKEWFFVANPGMDGRARKYADFLEKKGMVVDEENFEHHGAGMVRVSREVLEDYLKGEGAYVLSKRT